MKSKKVDPKGRRLRIRANRVDGMVSRGGSLKFYSSYMEFVPNLVEVCIGTRGAQFRYKDIVAVSVIGRDLSSSGLFNGGIRRRLEVQMRKGPAEVLVVNKVEEVAERIREMQQMFDNPE